MEVVQRFVFTHATHSAQMKYSGLPLVSTFSGERCTFGQGDSNSGWIATLKTPSYVRNYLYTSVYFMPAFFVDPKDFPWFTCMDGIFNWNSGWPAGNTDISYNSDQDWISMLGGRSYMPAVSPWFFTVWLFAILGRFVAEGVIALWTKHVQQELHIPRRQLAPAYALGDLDFTSQRF